MGIMGIIEIIRIIGIKKGFIQGYIGCRAQGSQYQGCYPNKGESNGNLKKKTENEMETCISMENNNLKKCHSTCFF